MIAISGWLSALQFLSVTLPVMEIKPRLFYRMVKILGPPRPLSGFKFTTYWTFPLSFLYTFSTRDNTSFLNEHSLPEARVLNCDAVINMTSRVKLLKKFSAVYLQPQTAITIKHLVNWIYTIQILKKRLVKTCI